MPASREISYQSHSKENEIHIKTHNIGIPELKDQAERVAILDEERRSAEMRAASLVSDCQSALLAKEELACLAESQQKSKEQLVSMLIPEVETQRTLQSSCLLRHDMGEEPTSGPCNLSQSVLGICAAVPGYCNSSRATNIHEVSGCCFIRDWEEW